MVIGTARRIGAPNRFRATLLRVAPVGALVVTQG